MFKELKKQLQDNFNKLSKEENLFYVTIDRDKIWDLYLGSFAEDVRQGENCNCCKSFLRQYAGIVGLINNKRVSIWDNIDAPDMYKESVKQVKEYIHSLPITDVFYNDFSKCGTDKNFDPIKGITWEHFHIVLPTKFVKKGDQIDSLKGQVRTSKQTFKRALDELTNDSLETVLDLISQNSLYRGNEFKENVATFLNLKIQYNKLKTEEEKENYTWIQSLKVHGSLTSIRNSSIGTLLINLSEGMELDTAVGKFEQVVAPTNYKRPTALVTPKMVESAKLKLEELGLMDSLERRYANETDLNVEDILFTDKSSSLTDIFGEISKDTVVNPKSLSKVEEISAKDFFEKVIPTSKSIEVLLENNHLNNLFSLVTSVKKDSKSLFKWGNNFSWSYTGGITDSIKERVKAAGGRVDGELRVSLSWFNHDDLDLHVVEPNKTLICFSNRISSTSKGQLDVDMNVSPTTRTPVENIIWSDKTKMLEGLYQVKVNNFTKRETNDTGYIIQIECNGEVFNFDYNKSPYNKATDNVVEFTYSKLNGITFNNDKTDVKSNVLSKEKWNIKTNQFTKVKKIMLSPNYWNNNAVGNKHYMFLLENCISDESARPFFNEFLKQEFNENRKVFEIMASKMKIEQTDNQLSGVGFSETQRNHLIVRVEGSFKRTLKINF